ncbi:MAG: hypothetical protein ABI417_04630 [Coleofasciculaceae cyanobacterium]
MLTLPPQALRLTGVEGEFGWQSARINLNGDRLKKPEQQNIFGLLSLSLLSLAIFVPNLRKIIRKLANLLRNKELVDAP